MAMNGDLIKEAKSHSQWFLSLFSVASGLEKRDCSQDKGLTSSSYVFNNERPQKMYVISFISCVKYWKIDVSLPITKNVILSLRWYQVLLESLPFPDLDHHTRLEAQKTLWVIHRNSSSKGQKWAENLKQKLGANHLQIRPHQNDIKLT